MEFVPDLVQQAAVHRALGDPHRLAVVAWLELTDATPTELADRLGLASNLVAFHLDVLEEVGLITRHRSQGDGRRRYVTLGPTARTVGTVNADAWDPPLTARRVVFVCTHNSARSQLASAIWTARTGRTSWSAGSQPADRVDPDAVAIAADHGLDLSAARPVGYAQVDVAPDLVVSVCDRVREDGLPFDAPLLHWSVPRADPVRRLPGRVAGRGWPHRAACRPGGGMTASTTSSRASSPPRPSSASWSHRSTSWPPTPRTPASSRSWPNVSPANASAHLARSKEPS